MTRMRNRDVRANYSSFILPMIIALGVIILVVKLIFGGTNDNSVRSGKYINISPNQQSSEIYIYMSGDSKKLIDSQTKMFSTDNKMQVSVGEAKINIDGNDSNFYLDRLGELRYEGLISGKQVLSLLNAQFWGEIKSDDIEIKLKNIKILPNNSSVIAFSQNAIASNVFVLKGNVKVILNDDSKDPKSTELGVGQKLTIMNNDLNDSSLNMNDKIEPIDDIFKTEDFFVKHNGGSYLEKESSGSVSGSGSSLSGSLSQKNQKLLIFNNPTDESTIDGSSLDVDGKIISQDIEKITLNDKEVSLNKPEMTFALKGFALDSQINNLVYKAYDKDNNLLAKGVFVVYSSSKTDKKEDEKPGVTTYPISSKDFKIIEPAENPFKTSDNIVKIAGRISSPAVKYITINGFRLTKFSQFSTTWYYFANKDYGTMNDGINLYTIKYYGKDDELLNTGLFTIVKESYVQEEITNTGTVSSTGSNNG
ncbi:MAG: hypothetical protein PHS92_01555 [Candidatus Gracilibacteria bacterium]|nr:hypothetical protein [Candidatus Gracilibacteria bacterium]